MKYNLVVALYLGQPENQASLSDTSPDQVWRTLHVSQHMTQSTASKHIFKPLSGNEGRIL